MKILGIETSCDETAASVVTGDRQILSNVIFSQIKDHEAYGGVVPEIAARAHVVHLKPTIERALAEANTTLDEIDAIAATAGPGLIGGVMVGLMTAKGLAQASGKPLYGINHLEGHALSPRLSGDVSFPFLLLLVSGGHCQILVVEKVGSYIRLGTTIDDAIGEAFDKVAKMLGLGYPGGPKIEQAAKSGNPKAFTFPKPLLQNHPEQQCNFSLSGLKTAVLLQVQKQEKITPEFIADISASFQQTIVEIIEDRMTNAITLLKQRWPSGRDVVVAGGVAANQVIRGSLETLCASHDLKFVAPPLRLCTDNAAMIAWAGIERIQAGFPPDHLDIKPRARWPLVDL